MEFINIVFFILLIAVICCAWTDIIPLFVPLLAPLITGGKKKPKPVKALPKPAVKVSFNDLSKIPYKNVLIVDVANVFTSWYMEKYCSSHKKKKVPYMKQPERLRKYIECATDHYKHFIKHNAAKTDYVNYVIKNFRHTHAISKHEYDNYMPELTKEDWDVCHTFVGDRKNAVVSVAIDYRIIPLHKWKDKRMHFLRGRDDYLCFKLAQAYKKKYINSVIMSEDKYRDFGQFGSVPDFRAYYIKNVNGNVVQNGEIIRPEPNRLGQLRDYKLIKITTEFNFKDPKFMKTNDYKIAKPGHVWD